MDIPQPLYIAPLLSIMGFMIRARLRHISFILALLYIAGCGSVVTMRPLDIHSANDMRQIKVDEKQQYEIKLTDGTSHWVYGSAMRLHVDLIQAYASDSDQWKEYAKPQVEDVYLLIYDKEKDEKRTYWKTGLAVLMAFAAASAGGYFIQKELR